jgi:hypothetical protein
MQLFRLFLLTFLIVLTVYTGIVIAAHGIGLLPVFFGDIGALAWPGQFNLDFLGFLMLSAIWVAWRHRFSAVGLGLAILAFSGGMAFLTIYLLVQTGRTKGDVPTLLMGPPRRSTDTVKA